MKLSLVVRTGQIRIISLRLEVNRQRARLANDKFIVDSQPVVSVTRLERERERVGARPRLIRPGRCRQRVRTEVARLMKTI